MDSFISSNNTLQELNLSGNKITCKGIAMIFDALWMNKTLRTLNISYNDIATDGAVIIREYIRRIKLEHLYIAGISQEGHHIVQNAQHYPYYETKIYYC